MSYTAEDLAALKAAYASGTLSVRYSDGRSVTFDSGEGLLERIRIVEGELSPTKRVTHWNPQFQRDQVG